MQMMTITSGKTIEQAIQKACEELSVTPEQIDVEILQESNTNDFFRIITGNKIKIRVMVKPEFQTEPPKGYTYYSKEEVADIEMSAPTGKGFSTEDLKDPRKVLSDICRIIEPGSRVERFNRKEHIILKIISGGSGIFIGNRGATLDSLQYLVNKIVHHATGDDSLGIIVDSENYRLRKNDRTESTARRLAGRALDTGKIQTTESLNAYDRRIVHITVRGMNGLRTESIGSDEMKQVQIIPDPSAKAERSEGQRDSRPPRDDRGRDNRSRDSRPRDDRPRDAQGGSGPKPPEKKRRRTSGRKPVFIEDQVKEENQAPNKAPETPILELRGEEGFDRHEAGNDEPIPNLVVDKKNEDN